MRTLNRAASEVLVPAGVRGATDVTGFGLLGHGLEMARASGTRFVFDAARAAGAGPGALELAAAGVETGGAAHNRRFVGPALQRRRDVAPELVTLAHDPQTSGGLLAAIAAGPSRRRRAAPSPTPASSTGSSVGSRPSRRGPGRASRSRDRRAHPGLRGGAADRRGGRRGAPRTCRSSSSTTARPTTPPTAPRRPGATVIASVPNQGKGAALRAGFRRALDDGADAVVTLDADGQHDPARDPALPRGVAPSIRGPSSSSAAATSGAMPPVRRLSNTLGRIGVLVGGRPARSRTTSPATGSSAGGW